MQMHDKLRIRNRSCAAPYVASQRYRYTSLFQRGPRINYPTASHRSVAVGRPPEACHSPLHLSERESSYFCAKKPTSSSS